LAADGVIATSALEWRKLSAEPPAGQRITTRLAFPHRRDDIFIGVDGVGHRHLFVQISEAEEELTERPSRGISVSTRELNVDARQMLRFIDIECMEPFGHAALDIVASELADALDAGATIERAALVQNMLAKWRRFWAGASRGLLSHEDQVGLFGELWFLLLWLMPAIGEDSAVASWRGPFRSRHDFETPGAAVEVKSTCTTDGSHIVNSLEQLLPPENGTLYFLSLLLREEHSSVHHLPGLIAHAREVLADRHEARSLFDTALERAGYADVFEREYSKLRLRVRSEVLYRVAEGFPSLVPTSFAAGVPVGVSDISYRMRADLAPTLAVASEPGSARAFLEAMRTRST